MFVFCSGIVGGMLADVSVEFIAGVFVELVIDMLADCVMHLCAAGVVVQGSLFARGMFCCSRALGAHASRPF